MQPPRISTRGELRASGHEYQTVKDEIRQNLLAELRAGRDPFPGIIGFGQTVLPQLERALIAGHDLILLGERGQGKTRLIRTLTGLLDEWTPVIEGCEINDHPYAPVCDRCETQARSLPCVTDRGRRPVSAQSRRYNPQTIAKSQCRKNVPSDLHFFTRETPMCRRGS